MNRITLFMLFLLIPLLPGAQIIVDQEGALVRSDTSKKIIYLCFTGHDFDDGFEHVLSVLEKHAVPASFFLTGDFIRNHRVLLESIINAGHYIGTHSDKHLLYCDWSNRDSLLHSPEIIKRDIMNNLKELEELGLYPRYFMPPFEWYNKRVVEIAMELNQTTVNFSPGTRSNADYTTTEMPNYISSNEILDSIFSFEKSNGLNGFHLLIHPGVSPERTDKFYLQLDNLIAQLKKLNYQFSKF